MPLRNLLWMLVLLCRAEQAAAADTLKVYFPTGISLLSAGATKTLDSALYFNLLKRSTSLEILGYADFVGSTASNEVLSGARAGAVRAYLLQNGFSDAKMIRTQAQGELPAGKDVSGNGVARHRRVDIIIGGTTAQEGLSKSNLPELPTKFAPKQPLSPKTGLVGEILTQTPVGSSFKLSKIFFPAGQHVMEAASKPELEALVEALKTNPRIRIRVEGHVCCIDTMLVKDALDEQTHEYRLSGNRARFVAQYLIQGGIDAARISHIGFGKRFAIVAHESTDEEAAANRRVEIRILEK